MFNIHFNSLLTTSSVAVVLLLASSVCIAADVDPTRPFGVYDSGSKNKLKRDDSFVLSSIIQGDGIHTTVINGKIYKMFDYVGEYRITEINSHSVILRSKSKRLEINIFKSKGFESNVIDNMVAN